MKIELRFWQDPQFKNGMWHWNIDTDVDTSTFESDLAGVDMTADDAFQSAMDVKEELLEWYWSSKQEELF